MPPTAPRYVVARPTGFTSIDLSWQPPVIAPQSPIERYEYQIDAGRWLRAEIRAGNATVNPATLYRLRVRGLALGRGYLFRVRAVSGDGPGEPSLAVLGTPQRAPFQRQLINPPRLAIQNVDRQSLVLRLSGRDCKLSVFYQESDRSWYGAIEVPVGTPLVSGRRLLTDTALMSRIYTPLAGDIWCRALDSADTFTEPGRRPWGVTHALLWEIPALG